MWPNRSWVTSFRLRNFVPPSRNHLEITAQPIRQRRIPSCCRHTATLYDAPALGNRKTPPAGVSNRSMHGTVGCVVPVAWDGFVSRRCTGVVFGGRHRLGHAGFGQFSIGDLASLALRAISSWRHARLVAPSRRSKAQTPPCIAARSAGAACRALGRSDRTDAGAGPARCEALIEVGGTLPYRRPRGGGCLVRPHAGRPRPALGPCAAHHN